MSYKRHIFDRSGFAASSDLKSSDWKHIFDKLDREQAEFLSKERSFRSPNYTWPRDPLHTWSRAWEYPYAYYHLDKIKNKGKVEQLKAADIGSGVTFFPFSIAKLGFEVTCVDIDPICAIDIPAASKVLNCEPGRVAVGLIANDRIPLEDSSQDAVYCISVLEHIPNFETTINEVYRILKPGGIFILTVDIDLRGDYELGSEEFDNLIKLIDEKFSWEVSERPVHPVNMLTSLNSPYAMKPRSIKYLLRDLVRYLRIGDMTTINPRAPHSLAVHSAILTKAGTEID